MNTDNLAKIKELKDLLDTGAITEEEFSQMKSEIIEQKASSVKDEKEQKPKRTGIGWPEVLGVLFAWMGGVGYLFTKQRFSKKLVVFILSLVATGVYSGLGESQPNVSSTNNQQEISASTSPSSTLKVGNTAEVDGRAITVKGWEELSVLSVNNTFGEDVTTSGKFIRVNLTAKNTSQETGNLMFSSFELKDAQGRTYNEVNLLDKDGFFMYQSEQNLGEMDNDIFPGGSVEDAIFFEVPKDASGFTFKWKNKAFELNN